MNPQDSQIHCAAVAASLTARHDSVLRVRFDRPGPGEELSEGAVADARPAASVILLRDSSRGPEVLLLQRNPEARFMGGAWVFPGGSVHADDEAGDIAGPVAAGMRETEEE